MSLYDDLANLVETSAKPRCASCAFYMDLEPSVRAKFDEYVALTRQKLGTKAALYATLEANGLNVRRRSFLDHLDHHHDELSARLAADA